MWAGADQGRHTMRPTQVTSVPRTARRPVLLGLGAFLALLVGAWGGIAPYVGPVFGYSPTGTGAWRWALPPGVLALAPGALAVVAAVMLLASGRRRPRAGVAGFFLVIAGAWFVIGPLVWRVLEHTGAYFVAAGPFREFTYQVGANLGPGLIVLACGAVALGRASHGATEAPATATVAAPPAFSPAPPATSVPVEASPTVTTAPPVSPAATAPSDVSGTPAGTPASTSPSQGGATAPAPGRTGAPTPPPAPGAPA